MQVMARQDITTTGGLRIAVQGASGRAVLSDGRQALVKFTGRQRGYWVLHEHLEAQGKLSDLAPQPIAAVSQLALPAYQVVEIPHFGRVLHFLRKARGLSQVRLAERMRAQGFPVCQATLSYRENHQDCPNGKFLKAAAGALQVPAFLFLVDFAKAGVYRNLHQALKHTSSSVCPPAR